jgi:hypothetical protein
MSDVHMLRLTGLQRDMRATSTFREGRGGAIATQRRCSPFAGASPILTIALATEAALTAGTIRQVLSSG